MNNRNLKRAQNRVSLGSRGGPALQLLYTLLSLRCLPMIPAHPGGRICGIYLGHSSTLVSLGYADTSVTYRFNSSMLRSIHTRGRTYVIGPWSPEAPPINYLQIKLTRVDYEELRVPNLWSILYPLIRTFYPPEDGVSSGKHNFHG